MPCDQPNCLSMLSLLLLAHSVYPPIALAQKSLQRYELSLPTMGTRLDMVVYAESHASASKAMDAGLREIDRLSMVLSNYDPESEVSRVVQRANDCTVPVSHELGEVLTHAVRWHTLSRGRFDITVGPLTQTWRNSRKRNELPSAEDIQNAMKRVGWHHLKIESHSRENEGKTMETSVQLSVNDMILDVSGLATGYIMDRAFDAMVATGVRSLLINIGGDIRVGDAPPGKAGWSIAVAGLGAGAEPLMKAVIVHEAVTSSGDLYQFVELDGRRYSHFIDPLSGSPIERRQCVTAFAKTTLDADAGATAIAVLGMDEASELFVAMPLTQAILVEANDRQGPRLRILSKD